MFPSIVSVNTRNPLSISMSNPFLYRARIDFPSQMDFFWILLMLATFCCGSLPCVISGRIPYLCYAFLISMRPHTDRVSFLLLPSTLTCKLHDLLFSSHWNSAKPCFTYICILNSVIVIVCMFEKVSPPLLDKMILNVMFIIMLICQWTVCSCKLGLFISSQCTHSD